MINPLSNDDLNIERKTHAGFPFFTSSAVTNTSGISMPAAPRAKVAYLRAAEVHTAHLGLGNLLLDDSCEKWESKNPSIESRESDKTAHLFHDGVNARKFDDSSILSGTLNNRELKNFDLTLRDACEHPETTRRATIPTSSSSGSSIPQYLRRFSAVRIPWVSINYGVICAKNERCGEKKPTAQDILDVDVLMRVLLRGDLPSSGHSCDGIDKSPIHVKQTAPGGSTNEP